jgi:hypothetical protein
MLKGILGLSHFATKDKDKVLTIIKVLLNPVLTLPRKKKQVIGAAAKESPQSVIELTLSQFYTETMSMAI